MIETAALHPKKSGTLRATAWVTVGRFASRTLALLQVAIFGRLLGPESFSLVATGILVIGILELLTEQGLGTALIQRSGNINKYLPTVLCANVARGAILFLILQVGGKQIATWFGHPESAPYVSAMGLIPLVSGFENLANITYSRELNFRPLVFKEIVSAFIRILVGLGFWWLGSGAWCLVAAAVAGTLANVIGSYVILPSFHGLRFSWPDYVELNRFGVWIMVSRYASAAVTKGSGMAVAILAPPVMLAHYTNADQIAATATLEISNLAGKVLLPALSRARLDQARFQEAFERAFSTIAIVSMAVTVIIVGNSKELVRLILGAAWDPCAALMPWISIWGMSRALGMCLTNCFVAAGQPRSASWFQLVMMVLFLGGVYPVGRQYGAEGICAQLAMIGLFVQGWRYPMIASVLGLPTWRVARLALIPFLAGLVALLANMIGSRLIPGLHDVTHFVFGSAVSMSVYGLCLIGASSLFRFRLPAVALLQSKVRLSL